MSSRLYVSNLSQTVTLANLRALFSNCGNVLEVEFAAERNSRSGVSAALVTMGTAAEAEKALHDLQGRVHCDRLLMITPFAGDPGRSPTAPGRAAKASAATEANVTLRQQYRDRHGMTYELDCSGKRLTLRFIFPTDDASGWQVEARIEPESGAVATGSALTREQAFRAMIGDWDNVAGRSSTPQVDWEQVASVLRAVKAL
jgi:hypothetical protein